MAARKRGNPLERWEIATVKAMLDRGGYSDQVILAYFTRPTRSVNHRVISEIRNGVKHKSIKPATSDGLDDFLATWPDVDPESGLSTQGDELLIKAREAMIAAVHVFNGAGLTFRTELFIVTAMIAWTYLLHAWFEREGIDFRYTNSDGTIKKTKQGEDCYWDLAMCLRHANCPTPHGAIQNLEFLIELRHEIEHRSTNRIDDAVSSRLQASCINFNDEIKRLFGSQFGLERRLPIALQFVTFSSDQRAVLKKASALPPHIASMMTEFDSKLSKEEYHDPQFAYRVAMVQKKANNPSTSDLAVEFVKGDTDEAAEINRVLIRDVDKRRFTSKQVWELMQANGYPKFNNNSHMKLWKSLEAKNPDKGFGRAGEHMGLARLMD